MTPKERFDSLSGWLKNESQQPPACPFCHSGQVLPFEEDSPAEKGRPHYDSLAVILIAGILLFAGYFLFMISFYLYYPAVIFMAVVTSALLAQKRRRQSKQQRSIVDQSFICLSCNRSFTLSQVVH